MTQLAPNLHLLNDGSVLDTVNNKVLTYKENLTWLLHEVSCNAGKGVIPRADRIDQMEENTRYLLPVFCNKIYKRGKTTYAELMDRNQTFEYPINGKRKINGNWVDFNFRMYPNSAYVLIAMRVIQWPHELYIVKHKKIEKA